MTGRLSAIFLFVFFSFSLFGAGIIHAQNTSGEVIAGSAAMPIPAPPGLAAESYLLVDYNTGKIIAQKDPDKRLEPASLTKMMTAYLVSSEIKFRGLKVDDLVPIVIRLIKRLDQRRFWSQERKRLSEN